MTYKFNPFQPNSPVYNSMFAGRANEISNIDKALFQAKNGNPSHIMFVGERGIGKTSLLLLTQYFAKGEITFDTQKHNFLTVQINLTDKMTMADLAVSLKNKLQRELDKINPEIALIKKCWDFVKKFEAVGYKNEKDQLNESQIIDDFTYSLIDTVKNLTQNNLAQEIGLTGQMDGLVILIDEADKANDGLSLGSFLKNLTETLIAEKCNNILFVLAGLPNLPNVLKNSHESSLRLFKECYLAPLSKNEINEVINNGIKECNAKGFINIILEKSALDAIHVYSEGYPHFVQQIGFSTLDVDTDQKIDKEDVMKGFFMKGGALECIGDRYYKKLYYDNINTDAQREILNIMSEKWNEWVSRDFIKNKYSKTESSLNNGIRALKDKNIILIKQGLKGQYRLQWASFAFWIKSQKEK